MKIKINKFNYLYHFTFESPVTLRPSFLLVKGGYRMKIEYTIGFR